MGDIAFNIFKDVNLNKQVFLDINKNVTVNVDNPDQLATAEADAEAFGPFALAEVDAYTVVTPPDDGVVEIIDNEGFFDLVGNTTDFGVGPDNNGDLAADTITLVWNGDPTNGFPPDLDDINATGALQPLDGIPPGNDVELPDPLLSIDDFVLNQSGAPTGGTPGLNLLAEYVLESDTVIDFGTRELDLDGNGTVAGNLSLVIPEGTAFIAEYLGPTVAPPDGPITPPAGPIDIDFENFVDNDGNGLIDVAYFLFDAAPSPVAPPGVAVEFPAGAYQAIEFDLIAESLNDLQGTPLGIGDYGIEAVGLFFDQIVTPGDGGTAFAYAESSSALDLNPFVGPVPG